MALTFSTGLFLVTFCAALIALLYNFGNQFLNDVPSTKIQRSVTSRQVTHYLIERGYIVCNITPVKDSSKWLAFLIKNGEYKIATVFTSGETIQGHQDSLV